MWGPVNGEKAALGWPSSHLKRAKKKSCGHKDKARQACSCLHIQILCLFSSSDFPLPTPPLSHFSLLFPPVPLPLPFPSSAAASLRWGFCKGFTPCSAGQRPCQAFSVQGHSTGSGTLAGAQVFGACAPVSWQSR